MSTHSPVVSTRPKRIDEWWFYLTAPQLPANPTFAERENVRRGRQASLTTLLITLYAFAPLGQALINGHLQLLIFMLINFVLDASCLFFLNRKGHRGWAGFFIIAGMWLGFAVGTATTPGGISVESLRGFDLMAASLGVVVGFFAPSRIFIMMILNIAFTFGFILWGHHSNDVTQLLQTIPYTVLYPPLLINIFMAVLTYMWVNSALTAIAQLDRTEEIVALERRELERQEEQLVLKQQLEDGIQQILQTHVKAANGDFGARAPLNRENILWQIAYSLNNLLSRLERYGQMQAEMKRTQEAVKILAESMRTAKANKQPFQPPRRTGTVIDELIMEMTVYSVQSDQPQVAPPQQSPVIPAQRPVVTPSQRLTELPPSPYRDNLGTAGKWTPATRPKRNEK